MAYKPLTQSGENFIKTICTKNSKGVDIGNSRTLLEGNSIDGKIATLPFSSVAKENPPRIWKSNAKDQNGNTILFNKDLAPALIYWFNYYAKEYDLDANVVAAQAYQESKYNIWIYNPDISTASGISQFTYRTTYDIMIINNFPTTPKFSDNELGLLKNGLEKPELPTSWQVGSSVNSDATRSRNNRTIFHQTIIDYPHLSIKAQCRLLKFITERNSELASLVLFFYSRGSLYSGFKTYSNAISFVDSKNKKGYIDEGLKYVESIFGILGDKDNKIQSAKPKNIWFGYDNLNLTKSFEPFQAKMDETNLKNYKNV